MKGGTSGPGIEGGKKPPPGVFLRARVTLMMKAATLLSRTTMTAICERTPALVFPRIFGFVRMQKSSLAEELVLSEADRRVFSFL